MARSKARAIEDEFIQVFMARSKARAVEDEFIQVFKNLAWSIKTYTKKTKKTCLFHEIGDIKVYINQNATYMTVDLLKEEYVFSTKTSGITSVSYNGEYNKKIEVVLLDAFAQTLDYLNQENGTATANFEKEIDKLFTSIIKKRKVEVDNSQKNFKMKVYI